MTSTTLTAIPAGPSDARLSPGASTLNTSAGPDDTSMSVRTSVGPLWTTAAADYPLDVIIAGELITVTAVSGTSSPQTFTVQRSRNGIRKSHTASTSGPAVELAKPTRWGARPIGGAAYIGGSSDTGGGTAGTQVNPNTVRIGTATYPLSGVDPTAGGWGGDLAYPGGRGVNQLIVYTRALTGAATPTNQYGAEAPTDSDLIVNSVNDRLTTGSTTGTAIPTSGYVLSGHDLARDWILTNATVGAQIELIYVAPPTGGGGTGGGGGGGGTIGTYPAFSVSLYHLAYSSSTNYIPAITTAGHANEIRVAFAFDQSGTLKLADNNFAAAWSANLQSFRAAGGKVIVSLGGAGNTVSTANTTNVDRKSVV